MLLLFVSSQMEEESRQRAQDALELARRHEEEDAVRRGQSGMSDLISPQNYFCFQNYEFAFRAISTAAPVCS